MKNHNNINIIFEDNSIIVCEKPSGVSSQSERGTDPDMVSMLKNYLSKKSSDSYVAVIHRLDKPVSGVMVYGKTKKAAAILSKNLAEKGFSKKYYAIVLDTEYLTDNGALENYLLRNGQTNTSAVVSKDTSGAKIARLNYTVIKRFSIEGLRLAILDIELLTGRHHQIRLQLSHAGFPILGDTKYNTLNLPENLSFLSKRDIKKTGLALFAYNLSFNHPVSGKISNYSITPSEGLWKYIK